MICCKHKQQQKLYIQTSTQKLYVLHTCLLSHVGRITFVHIVLECRLWKENVLWASAKQTNLNIALGKCADWTFPILLERGLPHISRSEQAPGRVFHPCDESEKNYWDFLEPFWNNIKVNPERWVLCGSYKSLVSYVAHQMKEKIGFKNYFFLF